MTAVVLPVFELNAEFLAAAAAISGPHGLTPAQWQVLAAVRAEPLPVAEIARRVGLGLARQSVQRVADVLVGDGWAAWADNPSHRRAKLLRPSERGRAAVSAMAARQRAWADAVGAELGVEELDRLTTLLQATARASRRARHGDAPRPDRGHGALPDSPPPPR